MVFAACRTPRLPMVPELFAFTSNTTLHPAYY